MNGGKAVPLKDALARRSLRLCSCLCLLAGSLTLLLAALQTGDLAQAWRAPLLAAALGAAGVTVLAFFVWRGIAAEGRAHAELSDRHGALVLNEERCKLALEGAGDGVWDWNIADGLAFYSPRARAILGLPAGDSRPRFDGWSRSLHTADAQRVRLELAAHVQGRLPFLQIEAQMRSHRGQGRRLLIRGMVAPERDAAGRPVRVTGTLTDVTERQPPQAAPGTPERPPLRTELDLALAAALGDAAPAPHLPAGPAGAPRPSEDERDATRRRELEIGARIQQALLVTAPVHSLPGIQLSSHNHVSQDIDGDFFEVIQPGEHCLDLIAGDVMGKGLNAALMGAAVKMQFSRSMVELLTARRGGPLREPAEMMAAVHRAVTPHLLALEVFVTLCYLRIDMRARTISWVGCGHELPVLARRDGTLALLHNQQPPLGLLPDAEFTQDTIAFAPGDALLMHSDGVSDALLPNGDRVGPPRVHQAFRQVARIHRTPGAMLHALRRELLASTRLADDATLVVARLGEPDSPQQRIELNPSADSIPALRALVQQEAATARIGEVDAALFAIAVVEAFTNVFRHGDGLLDGAPVELLLRRTARKLVVELVYLGDAFQPPDRIPDTNFQDYPEGGFGLTIIASACERVEYQHNHGVNTTRLSCRIDAN